MGAICVSVKKCFSIDIAPEGLLGYYSFLGELKWANRISTQIYTNKNNNLKNRLSIKILLKGREI